MALALLKIVAGAWVIRQGFTHISDDDYARVVIAEQFAHAPRLDPSQTSWLPFPFWIHGIAMLALGRSLEVATAISCLLGLASILVGYAGFRVGGVPRAPAWIAAALVGTSSWNAWLGVATVPEAWTGALIVLGAMTLAGTHAIVVGGAALLVASLSRYEAWPVCGVFAVTCLMRCRVAPHEERRRLWASVALAVLGPALWMLWNAHFHGSALHFVARVTAFHKAHAEELSLLDRILLYPRASISGAPELALAGLLGFLGGRGVIFRWSLPLLGAFALLAFLIYGQLHDGAPTHHPERALVVVWWLWAGFGMDGAHAWIKRHAWGWPKREAWVVALGVAASIAIAGARGERAHDYPGKGAEENRATQVARGLELRARGVEGFSVAPCAYEHFALIAAFGAPERVEVLPGMGGPVRADCPRVWR